MIYFISPLLSSHPFWVPPSFARFCDTRISSNKINTGYPIYQRSVKQLAGFHKTLGWVLSTFVGANASAVSTWFGLGASFSSASFSIGASFSRFRCCVFEFWVLSFRDLGASYFGLRFRVLRFRNYLSFWPHAHPKSKQYVFHLCSGQGSDPYCFFPVNPFVDETDLSFEKKRSSCPSNIISVKVNG